MSEYADDLIEIRLSIKRIERAVVGDPYDPSSPPGIFQRQNTQESHLAEMERRVIDTEERVERLESDIPGRQVMRAEFVRHGEQIARLEVREEASRGKVATLENTPGGVMVRTVAAVVPPLIVAIILGGSAALVYELRNADIQATAGAAGIHPHR